MNTWHSCSRCDSLCAALGSDGHGLLLYRPSLLCPGSAVGQEALAQLRQSRFALWADGSWARGGVLKAVLLGLHADVEAVLCGAERHSLWNAAASMHCFFRQ